MLDMIIEKLSQQFMKTGISYFILLNQHLHNIGEHDEAEEVTKIYDKVATLMNELKDRMDKIQEKEEGK